MSVEYQIGETLYRVQVDGAVDALSTVRLSPVTDGDGEPEAKTLEVRLVPIEPNTYLFVVHGNHYLAYVAHGKDALHVNVGGQNYVITPPEQLERQRRRGRSMDAQDHVTPPMPGQVIKILVEVGDTVEKGQPVIVISAMKMETNLSAPHAGVIAAIHTSVGAQVQPGDNLVDIEQEGE